MNRPFTKSSLGAILLIGSSALLGTSHAEPLPDPLTLPEALGLLDPTHPAVLASKASLDAAVAETERQASIDGLNLDLIAEARRIEPNPLAASQDKDDGQLGLVATKRLFDFGASAARDVAAEAAVDSAQAAYRYQIDKQALAVMRAYFETVEADLEKSVRLEDLATHFIRFDRLNDRRDLGQVSDVDVFEAESAYQKIRVLNTQAELKQRQARERLAFSLNRPGYPPSDVLEAAIPGNQRPLPEFDVLLKLAMANNLGLREAQARLAASNAAVEQARSNNNPVISGRVEAWEYQRDLGGRDRWRAALTLTVPLFDGGETDAKVGLATARQLDDQATLAEATMALREKLLVAWQGVSVAKVQVEAAQAELNYRELYLDRSRADYELEFKTDLGDAMGRWSAARLDMAKAQHALAIAWAELDLLTGASVIEGALSVPEAQPTGAAQ